ncbi:FtsX-like permease family protein [Streptococcus dentapri]|uniref:FtsX-like permease family protein n=1 Tax=Streptococcus dentapri TaxID=573564 RepID=A0ABV8CZ60_9STRE
MFYFKMAVNNLKNALNQYGPFMLASLLLFSLTCSSLLILLSPMGSGMASGAITLLLGVIVLSIFSLIMERYSYKILLKQRSREFGLYNILGMNKRQIGLIATIELGIIFVTLLLVGMIFSSVFSKFLYLIFVNIINYDKLNLKLTIPPFIITTIIFSAIFFLLELTALFHIRRSSPLSLFSKQEQGEKEPRGNIFLALAGLASLGMAYYLAMTSTDSGPLIVLGRFFIAVLLVIAGTYLFYISFMTWYLKYRRKNKNYYYQPEHFITTSQMIFRMKQNASGLASITLLVVMALVTIGTTVSLYVNTQNIASKSYPKSVKIFYQNSNDETPKYFQQDVLDKLGKDHKDVMDYTTSVVTMPIRKAKSIQITASNVLNTTRDVGFVYLVTQDEFRKLGNDLPKLKDNQAAFFVQKGNSQFQTLDFFGKHYQVVKNLKKVIFPEVITTYNSAVLVLANREQVEIVKKAYQPYLGKMTSIGETYTACMDLSDKEIDKISSDGQTVGQGDQIGVLQTRQSYLSDGYKLFGGLLFTGFLLGISFLLGIALIVYYKQYSEGYEDKKSYHILQEVGMSQKQVKRTINSQIILVFFMPLIFATIHFLFAIPMLKQLLLAFGVTSSNLIYLISGITIISIAAVYFIIYRLTSRVYYRIIER